MNALEIERTASDWLVKRTSGVWSSREQAEFDAWIGASISHRVAYIRIEAVWNQAGRLQALTAGTASDTAPARGAWLRTGSLPRIDSSDRSRPWGASADSTSTRRRVVALVAGVMVLLGAASIIGYVLWPASGLYTTRVGAVDTVPLADGSRITLNTDTRVRVALEPTERLIELEQGEAYFEVAKDAARPFIVSMGAKRVVAVGTKFSVRRDVHDVQVVVTEGSVRLEEQLDLRSRDPGGAKLLPAGSVARAREGAVTVRSEPVDQIQEHLSWRSGYLVFHDTPLADAVAEFNRYNRRKIVVEDPAIAAIEVGGNFKSDSTDVFLWMLQNGFQIDVDTDGQDIILKSR